ncbi:cytochrome c biogenesis CcdA family protein [Mycobacterium sp. NPDC003449]
MIDGAALGFALGAGLVAALNPCGFAFLPGYLGLVIAGTDADRSRSAAVVRAGLATVTMAAGFLTVFGVFGLLISPLIASAQKYLPFATVVIGALLVVAAVWLLTGRDISILLPKLSGGSPNTRLFSMYGYGLAYAVASLSCTIAPFLAVISTTFKQGSALNGVLAFIAYAVGMSITVGVAAMAVALAGASATTAIRRILPYVGRIAGVIVLLTGLYVTYYGYYEIRLYFSSGDPDDPIITAAGAVQTWLVRQVDAIGVWPLLAVLALLIAVAVSWRAVSSRADANLPKNSGK